MIFHRDFAYVPHFGEGEKAANSYLMSVVAILAGMPLPVVNFLATLFFYLGNRRSTYFVRWHCTQALLAQLLLFVVNVAAISWAISVIFGDAAFTNTFIAYLITAVLVNMTELSMTVYSAIQVNKRRHVEWIVFGDLAHQFCRPDSELNTEESTI